MNLIKIMNSKLISTNVITATLILPSVHSWAQEQYYKSSQHIEEQPLPSFRRQNQLVTHRTSFIVLAPPETSNS